MRWLISPSPYGRTHRLGVIWLQEPGGHHRLDGDHLAYLTSTHDAGEDLRSLDPDLYDRLRLMAAQSGRPVSVRETCRELPTDTVRFDRPLRFDDLAARRSCRSGGQPATVVPRGDGGGGSVFARVPRLRRWCRRRRRPTVVERPCRRRRLDVGGRPAARTRPERGDTSTRRPVAGVAGVGQGTL